MPSSSEKEALLRQSYKAGVIVQEYCIMTVGIEITMEIMCQKHHMKQIVKDF